MPAAAIPDGKREHASEFFNDLWPVFLIKMDDGFCIRIGVERMPLLLEFTAQFFVVVDLAVENDLNRAVLVVDWLMARIEVDDTQPPHSEPNAGFKIESFIVGTAVCDCIAHFLQFARIHRSFIQTDNSRYAAHDI